MPLFRYKAVAASGEIVEGEMEARAQNVVIERLHDAGHLPIRADEITPTSRRGWLTRPLWSAARPSRRDVDMFTSEIATLLHAGVPLDRSMEILIGLAGRETVRNLLSQLLEQIRGGSSFAQALEAQEGVFPAYYVSMVRAGEAGGSLETVLARLAEFMEKAQALRETIRSALVYPTILVVMAVVSIVVLLTVVLPQFSSLFEDAGEALPLSTRVIIEIGETLQRAWWLIALVMIGIALAMRRLLATPASRYRWDRLVLGIPLVGEFRSKLEVSRFCRTLATLLGNGVGMLAALSIVKDTVGNEVIRKSLEETAKSLKEGRGLAEPLAATGRIPDLAVQLIRVGEETGKLEEMLFKVANIFDQEVQRTVQRMLSLFVPALTITMGLMIAGIIGSIMAAILSVYSLPF